jgi:hypothetical protein
MLVADEAQLRSMFEDRGRAGTIENALGRAERAWLIYGVLDLEPFRASSDAWLPLDSTGLSSARLDQIPELCEVVELRVGASPDVRIELVLTARKREDTETVFQIASQVIQVAQFFVANVTSSPGAPPSEATVRSPVEEELLAHARRLLPLVEIRQVATRVELSIEGPDLEDALKSILVRYVAPAMAASVFAAEDPAPWDDGPVADAPLPPQEFETESFAPAPE